MEAKYYLYAFRRWLYTPIIWQRWARIPKYWQAHTYTLTHHVCCFKRSQRKSARRFSDFCGRGPSELWPLRAGLGLAAFWASGRLERQPWVLGGREMIGVGIGVGSSWMEKGGAWNNSHKYFLINRFDLMELTLTWNGTNISHLRKRKIILKSAFQRGYVSSQWGNRTGLFGSHTPTFNVWPIYLHLASLRSKCMVNIGVS